MDLPDIKLSQIEQCTRVLDKFLSAYVDDHYLWVMEPEFNSSDWHKCGREVFGQEEWHKIYAEVEKFARNMAAHLLGAYPSFVELKNQEHGQVCPHCGSIFTASYIVENGVEWACSCTNCAVIITSEADFDGFGV